MSEQFARRTFLASAFGAAGAVVLGGCAGGTSPGGDSGGNAGGTGARDGRPRVRMAGGPVGFPSPFGYASALGYYQMSLLYDTLLWKDSTGELLPWLASGYQRSPDGMSYTFTLREGLRWSDGKPLTADDVAFTFSYFNEKTLPPFVIAQPRGVAGARATGKRTVQVQLAAPIGTFPEFVAGAVPIVPRHVWEPIGDPARAMNPEVLVGSGAYRLDSFRGPDQPLAYTARDDYFLGKPFVSRIEMIPVGDPLAALRAGDVDAGGNMEMLGGTRPDVLQPFRNDSAFGIVGAPADFGYPLYFNLGRGGALADPRFRRACARAINRGDIVERLTGGNGQPGNPGFLPPDHPYHVDVEQYSFDAAAANAMLDGAGYRRGGDGTRTSPDGSPLSLQLLTGSPLTPAAQLVAEDLGRVGVQVTPRAIALGPQLFGPKMAGQFDLAILPYPGPSGTPPMSDPDQLRMVYSSTLPAPTPTGAAGYTNPQFDQLAMAQLATPDGPQRQQLVAEMQRIVASDLPLLPLYYSTSHYIFRREAFDQWYNTPGGFPVNVVNKQAFVTGRKTGLEIRQPG